MINEQIEHKLKTVDELLQVAELNAQYEFWNSAVNRLYYACFHAVAALMLSLGHNEVKTHSGVKTLFSKCVIKEGLMDREWSYFISACLIPVPMPTMMISRITIGNPLKRCCPKPKNS